MGAYERRGRRLATRVSDGEREAVLAHVREHAGAGRLDLEEVATRTDLVLRATTRGELQAATQDLPDLAAWRYRLRHLSLRTHTLVFGTLNAFFVLLWELTRARPMSPSDQGAGYWWPFLIMSIWAVGLALHAASSRRRRPQLPDRRPVRELGRQA